MRTTTATNARLRRETAHRDDDKDRREDRNARNNSDAFGRNREGRRDTPNKETRAPPPPHDTPQHNTNEGDDDILTKIVLLDGQKLWLKMNAFTDNNQIKHMVYERVGINPNSYQLIRTHMTHKNQAGSEDSKDQAETTIYLTSALQGGTKSAKVLQKDGKAEKRIPQPNRRQTA